MIRSALLALALIVALAMLSGTLQAQEMKPLNQVIDTAARPYPLVRCAALYQALMEWAGKERMGEDWFSSMDTARSNLLITGALISRKEGMGGSDEHVIEMMLRDARNIADRYLERFENNYASQGEAINNDPMVRGDVETCKAVAAMAGATGFVE